MFDTDKREDYESIVKAARHFADEVESRQLWTSIGGRRDFCHGCIVASVNLSEFDFTPAEVSAMVNEACSKSAASC